MEITAPHAEPAARVVEALESDLLRGLSSQEADRRRARFGPNALPSKKKPSRLLRFLAQLSNPLVLTLLGAAAIAILVGAREPSGSLLGRFGDAIAILLIVALNAVLGYLQEQKAESALEALKRIASPTARAKRDGATINLPAERLVPGDLIVLEAGDKVPADARLISTTELSAEESALTGESTPVHKSAAETIPAAAPISDQTTMVFLGSAIAGGRAEAVVSATGARTALGRIGALISEGTGEPAPLEQELRRFGRRILWACLGISAFLFFYGLSTGSQPWHRLLLGAVSFAVAAIPEGLAAITTITLALGMQRMAKRGAIVRRLAAIETLGSATVICSDKTGTLTRNEMTVREIEVAGRRIRVLGEGYQTSGAFLNVGGAEFDPASDPLLLRLLETAALCTHAVIERKPDGVRVIGDPTEAALLVAAEKAGLDKGALDQRHAVIGELPFSSERQRMAVLTRSDGQAAVGRVKGGVEAILRACTSVLAPEGPRAISSDDPARIAEAVERMSSGSLRVLAIAERRDAPDLAGAEQKLCFLGLVGMIDPPRAGVPEAIAAAQRAGVRVVMITGDHPGTATAIARELGLSPTEGSLLTGPELARLDQAGLAARIGGIRVFARTTAEQKLQIVEAFRAAGEVVAMTGDGVNDAPALRRAHIGVAMGGAGTDVAREASDLVITDDNFATIVTAIGEGRAIFRNLQKFIFFLLSSNAGLTVAVLLTSLTGQATLTPLMLLWINLISNGLPALALGMDPPDRELMKELPRRSGAGLVGGRELLGIAVVGAVMGGLAFLLYVLYGGPAESDDHHARTLAFTLLALSPLFHAFSCRSPIQSILAARPLITSILAIAVLSSAALQLLALAAPLRPVFNTDPMGPSDWTVVLLCSFLVIPVVELGKLVMRAQPAKRA